LLGCLMAGPVDASWGGMTEPAMSILSTSPTNSPVQNRQPSNNMDIYPMQFYSPPMPQMQPLPGQGQKQSRDIAASKNNKQRSVQGQRSPKQAPQTPRNFMKNNEITHQPPPWTNVFTVMMRNLPNKYTQHMLLDELQLNKFRLQHEFDFFYLPMDHYSAVNLGYCFINFVDPCVANAFAAAFQGRRMRHFNSQKTIVVMPASMQGFEKNYAYYSSTRVAQAEDPQYRPIFTRPAPCQEVAQFQPVAAVMWAQQPSPPYKDWSVQWPQQPYTANTFQQDFSTDDEQEHIHQVNDCQFSDRSMEICTSSNPEESSETKHTAVDEGEREVFSPGHSQRLRIRNTFLAVPERSPSVERYLERQCKSAPVSAPHSAVGSARIELDAKRPSGLDYAVVAAASCLAMDLGCVAVQDPGTNSGTNSSSGSGSLRMTHQSCAGSTTAESERDNLQSAPHQPSGSSCGSANLPSEVSPSESGGMQVLGSRQLPCKGSALHRLGSCKPCAFHCQGGPAACKNGIECTFCHLCEPGEKKRRKKEKQCMKRDLRDKIRQTKLSKESC